MFLTTSTVANYDVTDRGLFDLMFPYFVQHVSCGLQ